MHYSRYFSLIEIVLIDQLLSVTKAGPLRGHNISPSNPREFPFIASLGTKPRNFLASRIHFCTGSLISEKHILTAAHCFENKQPIDVDVVVGEVDLQRALYRYNVLSWITYEDWAEENGFHVEFAINDIAVVTLSSSVNQPGVEPVILTRMSNKQLHGKNAVIAGWGETNEGGLSNTLRKATVKILTTSDCETRLNRITDLPIRIRKNYLGTAADPYTLVDCGDSGGPLLDENNRLLGIIRGTCPGGYWGPLSEKFLNNHRINMSPSVHYYRRFIEYVADVRLDV